MSSRSLVDGFITGTSCLASSAATRACFACATIISCSFFALILISRNFPSRIRSRLLSRSSICQRDERNNQNAAEKSLRLQRRPDTRITNGSLHATGRKSEWRMNGHFIVSSYARRSLWFFFFYSQHLISLYHSFHSSSYSPKLPLSVRIRLHYHMLSFFLIRGASHILWNDPKPIETTTKNVK
jgi:hypothetical protein